MPVRKIFIQKLSEALNALKTDRAAFSMQLSEKLKTGVELLNRKIANATEWQQYYRDFEEWDQQNSIFFKTSFDSSSKELENIYTQVNSIFSLPNEQSNPKDRWRLFPADIQHQANILDNLIDHKNFILSTYLEVLQRANLEIELDKSENFLKETQRIAKLGTYTIDIATGNWTASEVLDDLLGIDASFKKTFEGGQAIMHPDWRKKMADYFLEVVKGKHPIFDVEYKIIRPVDKQERWVHGLGELSYNEKNEPETLVATVQDITERKLIEEELRKSNDRYRDLLSNIDAGVVIHNPDTSIIHCNHKAMESLGLSEDQIFGKTAIDPDWKFLDENNRPLSIDKYPVNQVITNKKPIKKFIAGIHRPIQKDIVWVLVNGFPVLDDAGNLLEIVISFIDITALRQMEIDMSERKIFENELKAAKEKAEESEKLKTAFLQNMSHEIRTPLNAITGFLQLLNKPDISPEKRKSFSSIIMSSSHQLLSIVSDILTISAIETKQEKLNITAVDINSILVDLLAIFKLQASNKSILLQSKNNLTDRQAVLFSDKVKITQILSNLLSNALKFTHEGNIEFGYHLKGEVIEFYVKDSGVGISIENQSKIFNRFQQADASIYTQYGGTGLGLSISKGFAELLGGSIWVESNLNNGSTFYFTIPYQPVHHNMNTPSNNHTEISNGSTVLIAEDVEINFLLLEELFRNLGCSTLHAKDGQVAVDLCKNNPSIDLVFMDIKMPILDGFSAAQLIREFRPDLPIIAQSGFAFDDEKEKYGKVFNEYISKPFNLEDLTTLVRKYITIP